MAPDDQATMPDVGPSRNSNVNVGWAVTTLDTSPAARRSRARPSYQSAPDTTHRAWLGSAVMAVVNETRLVPDPRAAASTDW